MKYIEYKNLCQGKKQMNNNHQSGSINLKLLILVIIFLLMMWLTGCRAGYNSPRGTGYVTQTPVNIQAEIPSIELPKSDTLILNKKMRDRKVYFIPEYKRETNYVK